MTSNAGGKLIFRNIIVQNCIDGASLHGSNAIGEAYDCIFRNCIKAAVTHVHTGGSFKAYRCSFEGRSSAIIGIGRETTTASANSLYEDCTFTPAVNGQEMTFLQATVRRCVVGTLALRVGSTGVLPWGNASGATTVEDSFVHAIWDQNNPVNMTGCYGRMTIRARNLAVSSAITNCVFVDSAAGAGADSLYWGNFDPGSFATLVLKNSVVTGFATALGSNFGPTDATYFQNAGSQCSYLCFNNNTVNVQSDLAALGPPYIANNIVANPLLGPCNTTSKADWGTLAGSPCWGAGEGGADIGFRAS